MAGKYFRSLELDAPDLLGEQNSLFRYRTRSACALFERCMPRRLRVGDAWRIIVSVAAQGGKCRELPVAGVRFVEVIDDPVIVLTMPSEQVGAKVLEWIEHAFMKIAPNVDIEVKQALCAVRDLGFRNEREISPRAFAPGSRTRYAVIFLRHEVDRALVPLQIVDKRSGFRTERVVGEERPDEYHLYGYREKPRWESPSSVRAPNQVGIFQPPIDVCFP